MALSTRELMLVLRISDRTGGALRRVAKDVGGLTSRTNLALAQKQQALQVQRANTARRIAEQNLLSARSGTQALRVEGQRQALERNRVLNQFKVAGLENQARRNMEAQLTNMVAMSKLERNIAQARRSRSGIVGGRSLSELITLQDVAISRAETLSREEQILAEKAGVAAGSLNGLALAEQKVIAAETELIARESILTEKFRTTSAAAELQIARLREMQIAERQLKWDRLERGAQLLTHMGRVAAIGGVIGTFALGGAARQAADFQTQLALAATQARPVGAGAGKTLEIQQQLMKVVLAQMREFPAASQEMANSLYEIFSGTNIQKVGEASQALKIFNQMAVAGGTDLGTMTQAGISLINNFDEGRFSIKNMTDEANLFFAAVRYGRMNAQQFADSFSNVIPIAKEAGLTFKDVADAMAFLTRQSGAKYTSRDATGLMREIQLFSRPEMIAGFHKIGVEVETTGHKMRPLLDIIKDFVKTKFGQSVRGTVGAVTAFKTLSALGGQGTGSRGFQGTAQAARIFAFQTNDWKEYDRVSRLVNTDTKEFAKSYAALAQTPGVQWRVFTNQLKALAITIGTAVIPVFGQLGGYIQKLIDWFNRLSPHTQELIAHLALWGSVGALVVGSIMAIIGGLASFVLTTRLALRSFGFLGGEAGIASARFALFMGVAGALLYVLIKYPGVLRSIIDMMGGTTNAVEALMIAITALSFRKIILGLVATGTEAEIATSKVNLLAGRLLGLAGIVVPAIVIPILYDVSRTLEKPGAGTKKTGKVLEYKGIGGFFGRIGTGIEFEVAKHIGGKTSAEAQAMIIKDVEGSWLKMGVHVKEYGKQVQQNNRYDDTGKILAGRTRKELEGILAARRRINKEAAVAAVQTGFPTPNIQKLEAAVLKAKEVLRGLDPIKDFKKYYDMELKLSEAQAALSAAVSAEQYKAYMKSVNAKIGAENKAQGHIATITKKQFFAELRNVISLRNAYLKTHSIKDLEAYWSARKKLAKESSDAERQYLSDAVSRTNQAYKKQIADQKSTYASALSNLTQLYNQFLGEQQQNLGQLFQGPVMSGQRMQTLFSWGVKPTGEDLLKDIRSQNFQYERFNRLVGVLGKRGAPRELVDQVRAAGPAAMQDVYALTKMTPQQWKAYVGAFKKGQAEVKAATLKQLNDQIAMYKQHGKNIAKAIVAGITSQDVKVQKTIDNLLRRALGIKPERGYHPGPHRANLGSGTVVHVHGHPGDARTKAAIRHSIWQTRIHTSGAF